MNNIDRGLPPASRPQVLMSVQALRGLAAVFVVIFHLVNYKVLIQDGTKNFIFSDMLVWDRGFVGVDMFFVISGFIMIYITQSFQSSPRNIGKFLYSRIARIMPLWWVFAALAAGYAYLQHGAFISQEDAHLVNNQAVYLTKSFLLIPQDAPIVLELGWTLMHEMYFYFVFALLLALPRKFLTLSLTLWGLIIIGLGFFISSKEIATSVFTLATSPMTLEFLFGAFAALAIINKKTVYAKIIGLIGFTAFCFFLVFDFGVLARYPVWGKVVLFGLPSSLIVYGVVAAELAGKFKVSNWSRLFGDWSYSLYLSHLFVLSAIGKIFIILNENLPDSLNMFFNISGGAILAKFTFVACVIMASVIFSVICYRFIEKPLIGVSKKLWRG